jgi:uncharacterized protein YuzE
VEERWVVKITYDREADAAYITFANEIAAGEVKRTYACDMEAVRGIVNLDFDERGVILGLEVLDASRLLPATVLKQAELL